MFLDGPFPFGFGNQVLTFIISRLIGKFIGIAFISWIVRSEKRLPQRNSRHLIFIILILIRFRLCWLDIINQIIFAEGRFERLSGSFLQKSFFPAYKPRKSRLYFLFGFGFFRFRFFGFAFL